jgi:hypothetical protein
MKRLKRDLWLLIRYTGRAIERVTDALIERSNRRERE